MKHISRLFLMLSILFTSVTVRAQEPNSDNIVLDKEALEDILAKYNFKRLYKGSQLPPSFVENKTKVYGVSENEIIIAYIDSGNHENGKFGIVIGSKGLYINNPQSCSSMGRRFISWTKFKMNGLVKEKKDLRIEFENMALNGLNSDEKVTFEKLLREIKSQLLI